MITPFFRIFSKSIKLTEIAQMKESQQLRQMNQIIIEQQLTEETLNNIHPMNNSQSSSHYRHPSSERKKETRLMTPAEILHHHATTSNANGILDVYDRMAIRGRIFTEKKRNFTPPVRQVCLSFICSRFKLITLFYFYCRSHSRRQS